MGSSSYVPQTGVTFAPFLVALIAIGGIVFACSVVALRRAPIFGPASRVVVAACVAVLSVIGLVGPRHSSKSPTDPDATAPTDSLITFLTLPYAALAISLVCLLIFAAFLKAYRRVRSHFQPNLSEHHDSTGRILNRRLFSQSDVNIRRTEKLNPRRKRSAKAALQITRRSGDDQDKQ